MRSTVFFWLLSVFIVNGLEDDVKEQEFEEAGFRQSRAIWFTFSSATEKQCTGTVRKIRPGDSITVESHKDYGLTDYPSNYQCRWLIIPDGCESMRVSCSINTREGYPGRCDRNTDHLRMIGYKGAFSNFFCGQNRNIHLNLNGKDALLLMFYSFSKERFFSLGFNNDEGFSCDILCRKKIETESLLFTESVTQSTTTSTTTTSTTTSTTMTSSTTSSTTTTAAPKFEPGCQCGMSRKNTEGRIVCPVGEDCTAEAHAHPWQAALVWKKHGKNSEPWCGGSVINDRYILTAAHCVSKKNPKRILIILGQHDWKNPSENSTAYTVSKIIKHPRFDSRAKFDYDFALLRLSRRILFDSDQHNVVPICLPKEFHPEMRTGAVTGWGVLDPNDPSKQASKLQEVSVDFVEFTDCRSSYGFSALTDSMFCASAPEADACFGDSGGPLAVNHFGRIYLEGVVSWGRSCASPLYPGVYADIRKVQDWISSNTLDAQYCAGSPRNGHPPHLRPSATENRGNRRA